MSAGGAIGLAWRHAMHNRVVTVALALCLAVTLALPVATRAVTAGFEARLRARAEATPLIAGAVGNRFDLTFSALYFRAGDLEPVPLRQVEALRDTGLGVPVGMSTRFTTRGEPLVGVSVEYFEQRELRAQRGSLPVMMGEVALGAALAERFDLEVGDHLFSDQRELYDIAKAPALKMAVCGVLAPTGGPDDDAAFVDLKTIWLLEGLAHGHQEADEVDAALLLGRTDDQIVISPALIEYNEVTPENAASLHIHGDVGAAPLTAILFFPRDEKSATLARARVNTAGAMQMIVPQEVIDDLMAYILRIRSLLDALAAVMGASTITLIGLITLLSVRIRAREMWTLRRIGAGPGFVAGLYGAELAIIATMSLLVGALLVVLAAAASDRLLLLV
ncbi:MAG: hypothetical protein ACF8R7_06055 [Phycisphaerales bacterium JB039]